MTENKTNTSTGTDGGNPVISLLKGMASLKVTVICLLLLTILTVWGTLYQADNGLYQAQQKFFHSWVFFIFGFIPFPGTVLVMFALFVNLVCSLFFRIRFKLANIGNVITHLGIIILLVGGGLTFYFSEESSLMLQEGNSSNMSQSRHLYELAVWEVKGNENDIYAVDTSGFSSGKTLVFEDMGLNITVSEYYTNCSAMTGQFGADSAKVINASGITALKEKPNSNEVAENVAGISLSVEALAASSNGNATVILYGREENPTGASIGGRSYGFQLRRKRINLPINVLLKDFRIKMYPNSGIVKSYESTVQIKSADGLERDVVISMNKPLRFANLTFFQSSYYIAPDKTEYSIFAVVQNTGRLLPYISSIVIFMGMLVHFMMMMIRRRRKTLPNPKQTQETPNPVTAIKTGAAMNKSIGSNMNYHLKQFSHKAMGLLMVLALVACLWLPASAYDEPAKGATESSVSMEQFRTIVIMENGRRKPLDTFAQNILKQFSGKSKYNKEAAIHWLARALFTPEISYKDKVFLVTNPEVLDSMEVERLGKARDRYSFQHLQKGLTKLRELAIKINRIDAKQRDFIENEIFALYNKLYVYQQITACLQFLFPHDDFTVTDPEALKALELPQAKTRFSLFDIFTKKDKLLTLVTAAQAKKQEEWSPVEKAAVELSRRLMSWSQYYRDLPLTIIPGLEPKAGEKVEKWRTPWDLLTPSSAAVVPPSLVAMNAFTAAYLANDSAGFDKGVMDFNTAIKTEAGDRIRERAVSMEVTYNKIDPFYKTKFFYGFSALFILLSFIGLRTWFYRIGFALLVGGFLLHIYGVVARKYIMSRPPVTNLYETFVFTGLITALLGLILEFFNKKNIGILTGALAGLVMMMIAGKYAMEGDTMGMLVAVLDSNFWLAFHVITIILGYAGVVLSGFIGHVYLLQKIFKPNKTEMLKNTFQAVYAIQAFGIIFTFLGTVLGGIWADQSWGRFWGWDPKENGALLILLWSAILFHAYMTKWLKETGFALGSIIGVICVALAWFGVNLLGVGLHSYGFTSGVANTLFIFCVSELLFVLITGFLLSTGKEKAGA